MTTQPFILDAGTTPLLVSMPHAGTAVPEDIAAGMTPAGRAVADTDWHVDRLYDFPRELGATTLTATWSRYVVDLNRPPDGHSLYPDQDTPGLVPTRTFAGDAIYRPGEIPDADEVARRVDAFWRPYHDALAATLRDLVARHGHALLWEAHTIRSEVPPLFDGRLPDINIGTNGGASCADGTGERLLEIAAAADGYTAVLDGRFRGGHITRHYGDPSRGVQAVQLELAQATYMDEGVDPAGAFRDERAEAIRPVLRRLLTAFASLRG